MLRKILNAIDPVTRSTGAALLCSVLTEFSTPRRPELCSETLAWLMLLTVFKIEKQCGNDGPSKAGLPPESPNKPVSSVSVWIAALGIAMFCILRAEMKLMGFFPGITPLLLITQEYLGCGSYVLPDQASPDSWFTLLVRTVWGTFMAASFTIGTLVNWNIQGHLLSIVPVTALLAFLVTVMPSRSAKSHQLIPSFDIRDATIPLSLRVIFILMVAQCAQMIAFGYFGGDAIAIVIRGLTKASSWYFMMQTAQQSSWNTATMAWTFSITSTRDPFKQSLGLQTMFHVVASFLVLGQVVSSLPRQARARSILWASLLVSYVPYLAHIDADKTAQLSLVRSQMHPVELLIQNAKRDFAALCRNQSQSLDAAQREYHRRYNQQPPPGFGTWYEFAKAHHSPMIDDFDMIYDTVSPFWKLSGEEFLEVITHAQNKVDADMWFCTVFGEKAKVQCEHPWRKFDRHLQDFLIKTLGGLRGISSEARFLVNHLDEPRVIIPPQLTKDQNGRWKYNLTDISGKPVWNALTKFCNFEGNTSITRSESQIETFGLPLVTNTLSAMDLCQHPEYSTSHGLVMSPVSFPLLEGFVPVLSTGAPSTMGDILFPSPAYAASEFQYDETRDVEWDQKRNNLYWAGSTTGGFAGNDQWPNFHRHRFVRLAQNLDRREHSYLTEKDGMISRVKSTFLNSRLFDVAFTRILHCKLKYCRDQHAYFDIKHWADKDEAFRSRLVFDIDGNGISGRYYKLLASKSVPLKQTILREWHDDRLMPWVHYIPVSQSMEELPDLVLYLTSTEAGQRQAKEIATQGREWFFKSFRPIDLTIYMYRLMLELARLQDPSRAASPAN